MQILDFTLPAIYLVVPACGLCVFRNVNQLKVSLLYLCPLIRHTVSIAEDADDANSYKSL